MEDDKRVMHILEMPEIVIEKILLYMTYEELAHLRIVCKKFNEINQRLLNNGFRKVERYQAKCLREVKTQLPRRESERRNHPLFRHCETLTAIETRLSLLNMTYFKYIDCHMCCFIPGKVIDEIYRVLQFIQNNKTLPRAYEIQVSVVIDEIYRVLQFIQTNKTLPRAYEILTELRDISSMAMEHFEEKIIRTLKPTSLTPSSPRFSLPSSIAALNTHSSPGTSNSNVLSKHMASNNTSEDLSHIIASNRYYKSCVGGLKKEVSDLKSKMNDMRRKMSEQERVALEQNRVLNEQTIKLSGQEGKLNELNRKFLEYDQRFSELIVDVGRARDDQQHGGGVGGGGRGGGGGGGGGRCSRNSSSTSVSSNSWKRDDNCGSGSYFVSHSIPATPTIASTVFVPANMMQPNLMGVNLSAAPLASTAYLPASPIGYPPGLALSMSPDPNTLSAPVLNTGSISPGLISQGGLSQCPSPALDNTEPSTSNTASYKEFTRESKHKKHRKRRYSGDEGSHGLKYNKS